MSRSLSDDAALTSKVQEALAVYEDYLKKQPGTDGDAKPAEADGAKAEETS